MRVPTLVWVVLVLLPGAVAMGDMPSMTHEKPNSANVEDAHHFPDVPSRGQPVHLHVTVKNDSGLQGVVATYCRVQGYSCAPPLTMTHPANRTYEADIPWTPTFFDGVTTVGYRFQLTYADGKNETSPIADWPDVPSDLPAEADLYYFYHLPAAASPGVPLLLTALALAGLALWRRGGA